MSAPTVGRWVGEYVGRPSVTVTVTPRRDGLGHWYAISNPKRVVARWRDVTKLLPGYAWTGVLS